MTTIVTLSQLSVLKLVIENCCYETLVKPNLEVNVSTVNAQTSCNTKKGSGGQALACTRGE